MSGYFAAVPIRQLPTEDGHLTYREAGSGPPLVFLHGGYLDHRLWEEQFRHFAPTHRVIAFDARGHGTSSNATRPYRLVDDLAAVLRALDAAPAVLVGLSMGGGTAVDCALEYPELVRALVVSGVGTSEPAFEHPWSLGVFADLQKAMAAADADGIAEVLLRFATGPEREPSEVDPATIALVRTMTLDTIAKHTPDEPDHRVPVTDTWRRAARLTLPLLALNGAVDGPDNHAMATRLAAAVPGGRTVDIPNAAHYPNLEDPARFNTELAAFLDRSASDRSPRP
ncbi:alpha/beta fold hydrolase [Kitasatospora sp. NPDC051853]|uniref:alpha/beta fold hydrolase n=1 Tax=Kitasatospora sp. NPDC051853 TaxID=3364058 RepID=UPI0037924C90